MFNPAKQKAHPNSVLPRPTQLLLENLELQQTNNPEVQRYATLQVKGGKLVESFQFLDLWSWTLRWSLSNPWTLCPARILLIHWRHAINIHQQHLTLSIYIYDYVCVYYIYIYVYLVLIIIINIITIIVIIVTIVIIVIYSYIFIIFRNPSPGCKSEPFWEPVILV